MKENKIIIDGTNAVLGRLSSFTAQKALKRNNVEIVNSEKVLITGREEDIIEKYMQKRRRHGSSLKGPIFPTRPERILKRTIRGMLPHRSHNGKEAYKRIKCHVGIPKELEKEKMIKSGKGQTGISLKKLSNRITGK